MNTYGGVKIEESVLLPAGWVMAMQDDGINTYPGPLSDMPTNPKYTRMKLPRDLYAALTAPPPLPVSQPDSRIQWVQEFKYVVR
jgi:hypothetical protein